MYYTDPSINPYCKDKHQISLKLNIADHQLILYNPFDNSARWCSRIKWPNISPSPPSLFLTRNRSVTM